MSKSNPTQQKPEVLDLSLFPDYTGPQIKFLPYPSNGDGNDAIWVNDKCVKFCRDKEEYPGYGYSRSINNIIFDPVTKMLSIFTRSYSHILIIINVNTFTIEFYHNIGLGFCAIPVKIPEVTAYFHRDRFFLVPHHNKHCLTKCKTRDKFTTRVSSIISKPKGNLILSVLEPPPDKYLAPDFNTWTNEGTRASASVNKTFSVDGDTIGTRTLVGVINRNYTSILVIEDKYKCDVLVGLLPPHAKNFTLSPCDKFLIWCEVNAVMIHYVEMNFTVEAPLFTVDGRIESLKFSVKDGSSSVVTMLKDGSEVMSAPLL
jgi:hypothetical protein